MEQQKVDLFIATNSENFEAVQLPTIRQKLLELSDDKFMAVQATEYKNPTTLLIVSLLVGGFGVDRFMLGETGMGVLKLLTCGVCGILTIIDWFTIRKKAREKNYQKFLLSVQMF